MHVLYIFHDSGVSGSSKIGLNRHSGSYAWPYRFMQARSHSPRTIHVAAAWDLGSEGALVEAEKQAKTALKPERRIVCHGSEWFDIPPSEMVNQLTSLLGLGEPFLRDSDPQLRLIDGLPYDDWRERSDLYRGDVWKRYLWVHGEDSPGRRFKVIHSPLYDIAYKYAFTYNPYKVFLVAAYEHPLSPSGPSPSLRPGNQKTQLVWEKMMADREFAAGPDRPQVGWLNEGVRLDDIDHFVREHGLVRFDLKQSKPFCARPRDSQGGAPIPHGTLPPDRRIADWWS